MGPSTLPAEGIALKEREVGEDNLDTLPVREALAAPLAPEGPCPLVFWRWTLAGNPLH